MTEKKRLVIIGGGGHSKVITNIIKRDYPEYEIIGYIDKQKRELELVYLGDVDNLDNFNFNDIELVLAIGQVDMGKDRKLLVDSLKEKGFKFFTLISKNSIVSRDSIIGEGSVVLDNVVVNVSCKIGRFCILNTSSVVEHDCVIGDFVHLAPGVILSGGVSIEDHCFLGAGSIVKHYTKICSGVILGAGSVVVKDITESGTFVGIPAKKIK